MRTLRRFLSRLAAFVSKQRDEQRLREEIEAHIARLTEDKIASGLEPIEARRQALRKFGSVEAMKEAYRNQRGLPLLDALVADVIFGWRQLRKHRVASLAAILSLALAVGAVTAAFRLIDAVLLHKLAVAQPEHLFFVAANSVDRDNRDLFDYPTFRR